MVWRCWQGILSRGIWQILSLKKLTVPLMFKELDPILHSQLRLAVMSLLIGVKEAEFTFIREKTNSTAGNLSVQVQKLKDAGYIDVSNNSKIIILSPLAILQKRGSLHLKRM